METKYSIFSEMSKMMTMPMMSSSDMKKDRMNFFEMYRSSFLKPGMFIFLNLSF